MNELLLSHINVGNNEGLKHNGYTGMWLCVKKMSISIQGDMHEYIMTFASH